MEELTLTTPALLFSAVSLILLAYTNRFYKQNEFSQGAGLGLSICQVIIEKLGGRIELKSEVGKGSRFTVILPCRVVS